MDNENRLDYDQLLGLNTHLISKNKKLEAELERRNDYIAELSHRLRTPLSAIFGLTALSRNNTDDEKMLNDCLDKIDFSSHMMLNTVIEILALDAVRKDNLIIHNACFDFKLLLSTISSMCSNECSNKDVYYNINLSGVTEETLIGDATYLNRILMILLMRAVNVTNSGGHVKLRVAQRDITKSMVQLQFCIIDSGQALSAEEIESYTNENDNSEIALVKGLCRLMNGSFSFESKRGIGTIFSVSLPFGINSAAEIITKDFFDSYRVLLITNDHSTLQNVTEVLERIGAECVFVDDVSKAVVAMLDASTMNKDFNLCLIDWSTSIPDGIENTREIRSIGNDKLKIAVITVSDSADIQLASRMAGADKVMAKPIFQSTVFNLMMELTGREFAQLTANPGEFDFSGCHVLFAEDNDLSARITQAQLAEVGIAADRADNGEDCIDILKNARSNYYDLVLLDMKMPYMDGCETASAIRHLSLYGINNIPIIALTADALTNDITEAYKSGMNDYVIKPIDTFRLYSTLAKYISKK